MTSPARNARPPHWRRIGAAVACLLWVLGFEIGPGVHVAMHAAIGHHHHAGDRVAHHATETAHDGAQTGSGHGHKHGHGHGHGHGHKHTKPAATAPTAVAVVTPERPVLAKPTARCRDNLDHGRHALAHRGLAVSRTPPAWPVVLAARVTGTAFRDAPALPVRSAAPRHRRARGPPAIA